MWASRNRHGIGPVIGAFRSCSTFSVREAVMRLTVERLTRSPTSASVMPPTSQIEAPLTYAATMASPRSPERRQYRPRPSIGEPPSRALGTATSIGPIVVSSPRRYVPFRTSLRLARRCHRRAPMSSRTASLDLGDVYTEQRYLFIMHHRIEPAVEHASACLPTPRGPEGVVTGPASTHRAATQRCGTTWPQ